jgi:hypothetical protein
VVLPQDPDDAYFDAVNGCIYVSSGSGNVTIVKQNSPTQYSAVGEISTSPGARTSLLVPDLGLYFVASPASGTQGASVLVYRVG